MDRQASKKQDDPRGLVPKPVSGRTGYTILMGEVDPRLAQVLKQLVTGPSAIDADQDLAVKRFWGKLLQRLVEDGDVIGDGV